MLFISLFMKFTHIQVFNKRMHEARIKYLVYKQIPLFLLMFCMFRYSYNKYDLKKIYLQEYRVYLQYKTTKLVVYWDYTS